MKELYKEIKLRLEQVTNRLVALEAERVNLQLEQTNLSELEKLYKKLEYDSITEERRVTANLLQVMSRTHSGGREKGNSQYDEAIKTIFENPKAILSLKYITRALYDLTGKDLNNKNVDQILRNQRSKGIIKRVGPGQYQLGSENNAGTETIPE
jgi:hypothetical protein